MFSSPMAKKKDSFVLPSRFTSPVRPTRGCIHLEPLTFQPSRPPVPAMLWRAMRAPYMRLFQAEDGLRDYKVTGVQTCALPISRFVQAQDGIRDYKVTGVQTCALPIWVRMRIMPQRVIEIKSVCRTGEQL